MGKSVLDSQFSLFLLAPGLGQGSLGFLPICLCGLDPRYESRSDVFRPDAKIVRIGWPVLPLGMSFQECDCRCRDRGALLE